MPGVGQVGRTWDLKSLIDNYEQRINTLEKLARGAGTSMFLVDTPRFSHRLGANLNTTSGTHYFLEFDTADAAPEHDVGTTAFMTYSLVAGDPRYIANVDGLFNIRVNVQWGGGASLTNRKVHIVKGAQTTPWYSIESAAVGGAGCMEVNAGELGLLAGEYFRIGAYQASGGNVLILSNSEAITSSGGRGPSRLTVRPVGAYNAE